MKSFVMSDQRLPSTSEAEAQTPPRRRRTLLQATPRSAASTLGRRRNSIDMSDVQQIEMNLFDTMSPRSPPPADPMEQFYHEVSVGEVRYTQSIEEDLQVLRESGFIIDVKKGFLGSGFYGEVFKGVYGPEASKLKDLKGQPLRNVSEGQPFAVKLVDFCKDEKSSRKAHFVGQTQEKRESYEMEKYIMTYADHPNITTIRMAINMGEPHVFNYQKSDVQYVQHDRVYLIMDLAQLGSLMEFVKRFTYGGLQPTLQMKLVRDCFAGLKYLHDKGIAHGDIHMGNVLIFQEEDIIAKWTDFGLAFVSGKGEYIYNSRAQERKIRHMLAKRIQTDCERFGIITWQIMKGRKRDQESPDIQHIVDRYWDMIDALRKAQNLNIILQQFQDILGYNEQLV